MENLLKSIPQGKTLHLLCTRTSEHTIAVTVDFDYDGKKQPVLVEGEIVDVLDYLNDKDLADVQEISFNAERIAEAKKKALEAEIKAASKDKKVKPKKEEEEPVAEKSPTLF